MTDMKQDGRRYKTDKTTMVFLLFLGGMAVYYGWRMFALTPWYDELYTYYYFISRGPAYAAIHWPLPNNHIGYSVLSACLSVFGNAIIALRGISYLCSLGSLILLYRIGMGCLGRRGALMLVFLYSGMHIVNQLAVQGRGYSLVTFCYLMSIVELFHITVDHRRNIKEHALFGASLVMALYAIPSSVYVVVPVCLVGGILLLIEREYRELARLVITSLASAACTLGLYGVVWLAIGSNLLVKTEGSAYYGMGHVAVIMHAPFAALKTGIGYMLATPYIQSVGREGFLGQFAGWLRRLFNEYYVGGGTVLATLVVLSITIVVVSLVKRYRDRGNDRTVRKENYRRDLFVEIYLLVSVLCIPLMLLIQCALPYYRVFSFAGVLVAMAVAWLWHMLEKCFSIWNVRIEGSFGTAGVAVCGILCISLLCTPAYRAQYGGREAAIEDAYAQIELTQYDKIAVTDCDQEYLLLFLYNIEGEHLTRNPAEAEVVLADKYLLLCYDTELSGWSGDDWKLYLTAEQFEQSGVKEYMEAVYENERFVLFKK